MRDFNVLKASRRRFDIVLLSCERDQAGFDAQRRHYPFLAVPFDEPKREAALAYFKVSAIPRLVVLSPKGHIIVDNAAGGAGLSIDAVDAWLKQHR